MKVEDVVLRVWETTRLKEAAALVQLYAAEGTKELKAEVKKWKAESEMADGCLDMIKDDLLDLALQREGMLKAEVKRLYQEIGIVAIDRDARKAEVEQLTATVQTQCKRLKLWWDELDTLKAECVEQAIEIHVLMGTVSRLRAEKVAQNWRPAALDEANLAGQLEQDIAAVIAGKADIVAGYAADGAGNSKGGCGPETS